MLPRRSFRCVSATISEDRSSGVGSVETPRAPLEALLNTSTGVAFEGVAQMPLNCRGAALPPAPTYLSV